jgi:hypothetical protein
MKLLFNSIILCLISLGNAQAQNTIEKTVNFSAGVQYLVLNSDTASRNFNNGLGVNTKAEYRIGEHSSIIATLAINQFKVKTNRTVESITSIPLQVGSRYYLGNFYASTTVGINFQNNGNKKAAFIYCLGLGDEIRFNKGKNSIDVFGFAEQTNNYTKFPYIGVRLSYEFKIN